MRKKSELDPLEELENTQAALRENIEASKRLIEESQEMLTSARRQMEAKKS